MCPGKFLLRFSYRKENKSESGISSVSNDDETGIVCVPTDRSAIVVWSKTTISAGFLELSAALGATSLINANIHASLMPFGYKPLSCLEEEKGRNEAQLCRAIPRAFAATLGFLAGLNLQPLSQTLRHPRVRVIGTVLHHGSDSYSTRKRSRSTHSRKQ